MAEQSIQVYQQAIEKFKVRTGPNHSFQVMAGMISAMLEQPATMAIYAEQPDSPGRVDNAIDATNLVKNMGEMVLGHLSRVWKEGYEAGLDDGLRQAQQLVAGSRPSVRSLFMHTARRVKNRIRKFSNRVEPSSLSQK